MSEETKKCPDYGEEILAAAIKCQHCGSDLNKERKKTGETLGWLMLIIPFLAVILMWFWIADTAPFILNLVSMGAIILTAILCYRESSQLGFGTQKHEIKPIVYFIGMVLLWPLVFPMYFYQRRKKGGENRIVGAILIVLVFSGSYLIFNDVFSAIIEATQPTDPATLSAVHDWLGQQAIPLRAIEAGNGFDDLAPLKPLFKDVRIVALGEATHGTREFFQFKHRMLEFLVTQMGFTVFAIEASYPGCQPIDDYVIYGKGDPDQALAGQGFRVWNTQGVRDLIEWLHQYNAQQPVGRRVHFLGYDIQRYTRAFSAIREYLTKTAPDKLADAEAAMKPLWFDQDLLAAEDKIAPYIRDWVKIAPALDAIGTWLDEHREQLIGKSSKMDYMITRQHVRVLQQFVHTYASGVSKSYQKRDQVMADNVRWIFDFLGPETRMVLWAHNSHVHRETYSGIISMGSHLRAAYGQAYYALGFDFNEGAFQSGERIGGKAREMKEFRVGPAPEESVGWVFTRVAQQLPSKNFIVDFRSAPSQGPVANWLATPHRTYGIGATFSEGYKYWNYMPTVALSKEFDGLIFIGQTTRARPAATPTDTSGIEKQD